LKEVSLRVNCLSLKKVATRTQHVWSAESRQIQ
jgi:hypothetical protein